MKLRDIKPSLLSLSVKKQFDIHQQVRLNRTVAAPTKVTRKAGKGEKISTIRKGAVSDATKSDPAKLRELLRLLGEDV